MSSPGYCLFAGRPCLLRPNAEDVVYANRHTSCTLSWMGRLMRAHATECLSRFHVTAQYFSTPAVGSAARVAAKLRAVRGVCGRESGPRAHSPPSLKIASAAPSLVSAVCLGNGTKETEPLDGLLECGTRGQKYKHAFLFAQSGVRSPKWRCKATPSG